ncbi:hypothetical protein [Fusobacterium gastrosuis]|uniref:hypothetical protein n=1 Tax=Fusobacterium gastrosuis TaxID=1755100 RepID=UPI0029708799|nr:hypothetical protein [Fusobacteriaceae bacterium]MDY5713655.1 hypothetical protein [Fusobacterium gastrosuis]
MDEYFKYLIKVIANEKIKYNGEDYNNIIFKQSYTSAETFKKSYKEIFNKYNEQGKILTYECIRGKWYECKKPKIRITV